MWCISFFELYGLLIIFYQNLTSHWIHFDPSKNPRACFVSCIFYIQRLSTLFFFSPRNILVSSNKVCKFSCSLSLSFCVSHAHATIYIYIYVTEQYYFRHHISAFSTNMSSFRDYKPAMAMLVLQFCYAGVALSTRAALLQGMNPRVFVVYRQGIATLVITPMAYLSRCVLLIISPLYLSQFQVNFC